MTEGKSLYISRALGNDTWSCDLQRPCKSIWRVVKLASSGDHIYLDGTNTDKDPYNCSSGTSQHPGIYTHKSLSLIGSVSPMPQIQCSEGTGLIFNGSDSEEQMKITISGLLVNNSFVSFQDSSVYVHGCKFQDSVRGVEINISARMFVDIQIVNSSFSRNSKCISVNVNSKSSSFQRTQVTFKIKSSLFEDNFLSDDGKVISFAALSSTKQSVSCNAILESTVFHRNMLSPKGLIWVDTRKASQFIKLHNVTVIDNYPSSHQAFTMGGYSECIVNSNEVTISINSSNFRSQHARSFNIIASNISVAIYNSSFTGQRVVGSGGAISLRGNYLHAFNVYNSFFVNTAADEGGAISIESATVHKVSFFNDSFTNNTAKNGKGGALYIYTSGSIYKNFQYSTDDNNSVQYIIRRDTQFHLSVTNCVFINASSSAGGGGIHVKATKVLMRLRHSAFIGCSSNAQRHGGGGALIDVLTSDPKRKPGKDFLLIVEGSRFERCRQALKTTDMTGGSLSVLANATQIEIVINNSDFISNHRGAVAVYSPQNLTKSVCNVTVNNSVFLHNNGTPIVTFILKESNIVFENVTIESNSGGYYGGAFIGFNATLSILGSRFLKNRGSYGGALAMVLSKLRVFDSVFDGNHVRIDYLGPLKKGMGFGGAMNIFGKQGQSLSVEIYNATFKNCSASLEGGAISIKATDSAYVNVKIKGSKFAQNSVFAQNENSYGGAVIIFVGTDTEVDPQCFPLDIFWSCKSRGNRNFRLWDYRSYFLFENTTFLRNAAVMGGAIYLKYGNATFRNCSFSDNFAANLGGHIYIGTGSSSLHLQSTVFNQTINQLQLVGERYTIGSFLHSETSGALVIHNTTMDAKRMYDSIITSYLLLVQNVGLIDLGDNNLTRFYCPHGMKMDITNFTTCEVQTINDTCSIAVDIRSLRYYCLTCPQGKYSLNRGGAFGNELIPGFQCLPCPFGANCSENIIAKNNFWGFEEQDTTSTLQFTLCPLGYCRSPDINDYPEYNGCQGYRSGKLCGQCSDAYSETLYSTHCRPSQECNDYWFWPVSLLYVLVMALYFTFRPPFAAWTTRQIFWFKKDEIENEERNFSRGYLKIVFYLYQAADILLVSNSSQQIFKTKFVEPLIGMFNFQQKFSLGELVCPFPGLTLVTKQLFCTSQVIGTYLMIGIIYIVHWGIQKFRGQGAPFVGPYIGGILQTILLGYATLVSVSFDLLRCVPIGSEKRLFYDGNVECFQWWQYILIVFIAMSFAPFVFVLLWGPIKLFRGSISAGKFLLACCFPLPYLLYWVFAFFTERNDNVDSSTDQESMIMIFVERVLYEPFKRPEDGSKLSLSWESVMIGRRLILIILRTFVLDPVSRLLTMTFFCVLFLLHHVLTHPFRDRMANTLETISLLSLVLLGTVNVFFASFLSLAVPLSDHFQSWWSFCEQVEIVILGTVPVVFCLFLFALFISQVFRVVLFVCAFLRHLFSTCMMQRNYDETRPVLS